MKKIFYFIAVVIFCGFAIKSSVYKSNKSIEIQLPSAFDGKQLDSKKLLGEPYIIHVFASWCYSCQQEHNTWLSVKDSMKLYGLSYYDSLQKTQRFLNSHGNPYIITGVDQNGITQKELDIVGLPQTFVIDKLGHVRLRIKGPVNDIKLKNEVLPLYKKLELE